ncbi:hypothetical protein H257_17118 [Aphanomyces astaci]|uniref:DDE-1 domain-containing protein n=1 Tax=Aphanomyces astaci TaxID=112090 RepID=W4FG82_APHAT|nr:hypothetical protein H257_17118 [Aphanomyces astaci]ETV66450.1 hypothetical protein H257_17118 [Aphanomyces astaci]|eukprot:XP_009844084.1 hypothetical protein H257_17118 [Aphanomyces astaci]
MIAWNKINQRAWLMSYLATKKSDVAYDSLLRLLRRFFQRYGFSRQRQTKNKLKQASYENYCVFNVDEAGMYYNLPPTHIWANHSGSAKISTGEKHSMRMTVGVPGARIETNEFPTIPRGHR